MKNLLLLFTFVSINVFAHQTYRTSGGLNSAGCHNSSTAGYHCHNNNNSTPEPFTPIPPRLYSWNIEPWGECTGDCGTNNGTQIRTVSCETSNGLVTSNESRCSVEKPALEQSCTASICPIQTPDLIVDTGQEQPSTDNTPLFVFEIPAGNTNCELAQAVYKEGELIIPQVIYLQKEYFALLKKEPTSLCFLLDRIEQLNCPNHVDVPVFRENPVNRLSISILADNIFYQVELKLVDDGSFCVIELNEMENKEK